MGAASVDEVLHFAIASERAANQFYMGLAAQMESQEMREVFEDFAREELEHKAVLEGMNRGKVMEAEDVADLKISDYVVDVEPQSDMDYKDALVLAMKREKASFRLYIKLAGLTLDNNLRRTFLLLANQEAKHKLRFEVEYDDVVLKEN